MIAIIIPVHNEERHLARCLDAAFAAAAHPALDAEPVTVLAVLNGCTDRSETIARYRGAEVLLLAQANVGLARRAGSAWAIEHGARWLAYTDADTVVADDWLVEQLAHGTDVVCGTVGVADWSPHGRLASALQGHFAATYTDAHDHRHVHGANLGIAASAYVAAGGCPPLACSEDVALVQALSEAGATIGWSARPRVTTSARTDARARGGFGDTLLAVATRLAAS